MYAAHQLIIEKEGRDRLVLLLVSRTPHKQTQQNRSKWGTAAGPITGVPEERHAELATSKPSRHSRLPGARSPIEVHKPDDQNRHLVRGRHPPDHPLRTLPLLQFRRRRGSHDRDRDHLRVAQDEAVCASPRLRLRDHPPEHQREGLRVGENRHVVDV